MATKKEALADPNSCVNKAKDDEPIFTLRAQDKTAPRTVRMWAINSGLLIDNPKRRQAMKLAEEMEAWQRANLSKQPD